MKILIIADIYGNLEKLKDVLRMGTKENPDIILCPGSFTDMFTPHTNFSQLDLGEILVQKLVSYNIPVLAVPGNHDPYAILDIFEDYKINLHTKNKTFNGNRFAGFGGAKTPFNTNIEPTEEETKSTLNHLAKNNPNILMIHAPPKNTKMDRIKSGKHVGSEQVREFILKNKPQLVVTAHIHEALGHDRLGTTTIFNPGPCFRGCYGLVEVGKKVVCRLLKT